MCSLTGEEDWQAIKIKFNIKDHKCSVELGDQQIYQNVSYKVQTAPS